MTVLRDMSDLIYCTFKELFIVVWAKLAWRCNNHHTSGNTDRDFVLAWKIIFQPKNADARGKWAWCVCILCAARALEKRSYTSKCKHNTFMAIRFDALINTLQIPAGKKAKHLKDAGVEVTFSFTCSVIVWCCPGLYVFSIQRCMLGMKCCTHASTSCVSYMSCCLSHSKIHFHFSNVKLRCVSCRTFYH